MSGQIENCTAVILCGGESRRMWRDKATAPFCGKPLWRHVRETVAPLFARMLFSVHAPRPDLPGPQVVDDGGGRGPMLGIASALAAIGDDWLFAIGCDMPLVSADLVRFMAGRRGRGDAAVIATVGGRIQPLPGFYARSLLPAMREAIESGERGLARLIARRLDATILSESSLRRIDPELRSFRDFDTPASLV